ncbi:LptA/OstA family protein, partial [Thermus scotoductus]|uniref:LptA/OstA family protein n=1 Tax=Thermus scotoductus TaxID=37636 RepID=UPI003F5199C9
WSWYPLQVLVVWALCRALCGLWGGGGGGGGVEGVGVLCVVRGERVVEGGGVEELFLSGGEARYLEEEGRLELRPAPGKVAVAQGQVRVEGQRLRYQNDTGEALLEGPLEVRREGEKPLSGKAGSLRYLLDEDRLWLLGGVELTQGGRTTKAERALLREKEGYAFLYGKVESRDERGVVRGERVRYALKSGEVVVLGGVAGEFRGD